MCFQTAENCEVQLHSNVCRPLSNQAPLPSLTFVLILLALYCRHHVFLQPSFSVAVHSRLGHSSLNTRNLARLCCRLTSLLTYLGSLSLVGGLVRAQDFPRNSTDW